MSAPEAFLTIVENDFEDRMTHHLLRHFPVHCEDMEDPELRREIRNGIQRAMTYHIVGDADVCRFIDLMFAFGRDFEFGSEFCWTREILEDPSLNSHAKIRRIYSRAFMLYKYHRSR